jgi:hypothetical protein
VAGWRHCAVRPVAPHTPSSTQTRAPPSCAANCRSAQASRPGSQAATCSGQALAAAPHRQQPAQRRLPLSATLRLLTRPGWRPPAGPHRARRRRARARPRPACCRLWLPVQRWRQRHGRVKGDASDYLGGAVQSWCVHQEWVCVGGNGCVWRRVEGQGGWGARCRRRCAHQCGPGTWRDVRCCCCCCRRGLLGGQPAGGAGRRLRGGLSACQQQRAGRQRRGAWAAAVRCAARGPRGPEGPPAAGKSVPLAEWASDSRQVERARVLRGAAHARLPVTESRQRPKLALCRQRASAADHRHHPARGPLGSVRANRPGLCCVGSER